MTIGKKDLLLVIDMQNVYLPQGKWACPNIVTCIPYIKKLLSVFPQDQVIFTQFLASKKPVGTWVQYNKVNESINQDAWSNAYISDFIPYLTKNNLYSKSTYSCTSNKDLRKRLDDFDNIYITGVVAECCVLSTIFELIDMGKKIYYLPKGIAGECDEKEKAIISLLQGLSPLHIAFMEELS